MVDRNVSARAIAAAAEAGLTVDGSDAVGLMVQSAAGVIQAATPAAENILGLTLAQMLGRDSADPRWAAVAEDGVALRPQDHPAMRAIESGSPVWGAVMGVHRPGRDPAGEHVWLLVDSVPLGPSGGAPTAVVTRFAIMTGQRATELRLAASERLYRSLVQNAPDIMAWQLADTTFLWVSSAVQTLLGREPEELVGHTAYEFIHPDDAAKVRQIEHGPAAHREPVLTPLMLRVRHRDGNYLWMEVVGQVLRDADGKPSQLRTAWRDVTTRVAARHDHDTVLQLVQSVVNNSPIGIAVCDVNGLFEQVNPALCATLQLESPQLLGRSLRELVHPDDDGTEGVAALLAGELEVHASECRYLRGNGTWMWGHRTVVVLRDGSADRQSWRLLVQLQDITESRLAQDELAYAASHDPLTDLANRIALDEHLERAGQQLELHASNGLLFIDIDDFKAVNDTYGHKIGDEVLRGVAARIKTAIRHEDFAARLGGDEFVVHCPKVSDQQEAVHIAQRIMDALTVPYPVGVYTIRISASIGVATATVDNHARLLAMADRAMYRAKQAGRGFINEMDLDSRHDAPSARGTSVPTCSSSVVDNTT
jgi:diguanylate cyclase (GGDEF)-like protein/PAS domain S-box-containing protein